MFYSRKETDRSNVTSQVTFAPRVGGVLSQNVLSFPGQSTSGLTSILDAKQARGSHWIMRIIQRQARFAFVMNGAATEPG